MNRRLLAVLAFASACAITVPARAGDDMVPPPLRGIRIEDRSGATLPLDVAVTDQDGSSRALGELFGEVPIVLVLGYYECPMLCGVVFEHLRSALGSVPGLGRDYRALAVSIDPRDTAEDARARRDRVLGPATGATATAGRIESSAWPFLVAGEDASRAIAGAVGFHYRFDRASGQYAHATGAFVLTPDGRVSRTFQGLDFDPGKLAAAIADARSGRIVSRDRSGPFEAVLVQCFRFVPALRRHAGALNGFLRAGAAAIVVALGAVIAGALRKRRAAERPQ